MNKYPTSPGEMAKSAAESYAVLSKYADLFEGLPSFKPVHSWIAEVCEVISDIEARLETLRDSQSARDAREEIHELSISLEDTLDSKPDGHQIQDMHSMPRSDDFAELVDRICEQAREIAYALHTLLLDAHLW